MKIRKTILALSTLGFLFVSASAEAIPAFARKYQTNCSACHTAFPQLNKAGRKFKEAGYRFPKLKGEESISDFLHLGKYFPVSAVIKGRPYDKKDSGDEKLRAIHEVELIVGGILYKNVSGFFEFEAEDEDTNARGFEVGIPHAVLTWNYSKAFNVQLGWAGLIPDDPYDTYGHRRLTRNSYAISSKSLGGADNGGSLGTQRQSIGIYGRPVKNLYYSVGISGVADDSEGVNPGTYYARLAWDVIPQLTVGLLVVDGECESSAANCAVNRDFSRTAIDAQAKFGNFRFEGAYLQAKDDNATATSTDRNDLWYLQGQYIARKNGRPTFVPLVRLESYEQNDGNDDFDELTLNLTYYFTQNIKGFVEYWDRYNTPTGVREDDRLTFQVEAAF